MIIALHKLDPAVGCICILYRCHIAVVSSHLSDRVGTKACFARSPASRQLARVPGAFEELLCVACQIKRQYRRRQRSRDRDAKYMPGLDCIRPCSVATDWSPGLIPSRITSLIYIDFDELESILVYSGETEQGLNGLTREPRSHDLYERQTAINSS
jgi:hypothetical protein